MFSRLFLFMVAFVFLISCDEITSPSDNETDFFPLELGRYWVYQNHSLDLNGSIISESQFIDSVVVDSKVNINGVQSFMLIKYLNSIAYDTSYYFENNNMIYHFDNPDTLIENLTIKWLPIINFDIRVSNSWNVFNNVFKDYTEIVNEKEFLGSYYTTQNGTYEYMDTAFINNSKYLSKVFSNKYDSKLEFNIINKVYYHDSSYYYDTLVYRKIMSYKDEFVLSEGVGFKTIKRNPYSQVVSTTPSSTISSSRRFNGYESRLLRFGKN